MEIELRIKDTICNQHIFHSISLETFKYFLENEPKVLLNEITKIEERLKSGGIPSIEPTTLLHITP